jgi:rhodanese-related sulfurtransferase
VIILDILTIVLASVAGILIGLLVTNSKKYDYTNIKFLTVEDFQKNMRKGQLIDIQKKDEFEKDKIKGARNFKPSHLSGKYSKLRKDQSVYLYCKNGSKSKKLAKKMIKNGHQTIFVLDGGLNALQK